MPAFDFALDLFSELSGVRDTYLTAYVRYFDKFYRFYFDTDEQDASRDAFDVETSKRATELFGYKLRELAGKLVKQGFNPETCIYTHDGGALFITDGSIRVRIRLGVQFPATDEPEPLRSLKPALVHHFSVVPAY